MSGTVIVLKYSDAVTGATQPAQNVLSHAEPAYTFKNGILWIGEYNSDDGYVYARAIGGQKFTNMLDHTEGTLTANSAILVDSNKWVDELITGGLTLTTSGGTAQKVTSISTDGTFASAANSQLATASAIKTYVDTKFGLTALTLIDDDGTSSVIDLDSESITFGSSSDLNSELTVDTDGNITITYELTDTGVVVDTSGTATYGSGTAIPYFEVDAKGRIVAAGENSIATTLTVVDGSATSDVVDLLTESLVFANGTGIDSVLTSATDGTVTVTHSLTNTLTEQQATSWGSANKIPVITVNRQGRITSISDASIATSLNILDDGATGSNTDGSETVDLLEETLTIAGGTGLSSLLSVDTTGNVTITIDLDDTAVSAGSYGTVNEYDIPTFTVDPQGRLTAAGVKTGQLLFTGDSGTAVTKVLGSTLTIAGTAGRIVTSANSTQVAVDLATVSGVAGNWGASGAKVPYFTVDAYGRITAVNHADIATSLVLFDTQGGGSNTDNSETVDLLIDTLTFDSAANSLITTTLSRTTDGDVTLTLDLGVTGVTADTYGDENVYDIPTFTVDSRGRLTAAGVKTGYTVFTADNVTTGTIGNVNLGDTLTISGGTALTSTLDTNSDGDLILTVDLDNTAVNAASYGDSATAKIPTFTVDAQGRLTAASEYTGQFKVTADDSNTITKDLGSSVTISGGTALTSKVSAGSLVIDLDDTTSDMTGTTYGSATAIPTFTVDRQGRLLTAGTVSVNANSFGTVQVTDTDSGFNWAATGDAVASSNAATVKFVSGNGIDVDVDAGNDAVRFTNTGVVALSTDNHITIEADTSTDAVAGSFIISSDATSDATANTIVLRDNDGNIHANVLFIDSIDLADVSIENNSVTVKAASTHDNLVLRGNTNGLVEVDDDLDVAGSVYIAGDLTVVGSTTTLSAQNLSISDNMIYLNGDQVFTITAISGDGTYVTYTTDRPHGLQSGRTVIISGNTPSAYNTVVNTAGDGDTVYDAPTATTFRIENTETGSATVFGEAETHANTNPDIGIAGSYNDGTYAHAGVFRDATDGVWKFYDGYTLEPDADIYIDTTHASFSLADILANTITADGGFVGNLTGNADTASKWATSRTVSFAGGDVAGSFSIDGSGDVSNVALTIQANSVALGTDTTGNYVATIASSGGTIVVSNSGTENAAINLEVDFTASTFTEAVQDAVGDAIDAGTQTDITVTYNDVTNSIDFTVPTATTSTKGVSVFSAYADAYRATLVADGVTGATQNETPNRPAWSVTNGVPTLLRIEGGMF